jgi:hypothetical protein
METNGLYASMLTGLAEVNLSASARKNAECQMSRAMVIMEMLIGKSDRSSAKKTEGDTKH